MTNEQDRGIEKIIVIYDDGEQKELEKGLISTVKYEDGDNIFTSEMANLSGEEFLTMLDGFVTMWAKINNIE